MLYTAQLSPHRNTDVLMEHRFRKTIEGCEAITEDEQMLFGVLLSEEGQQLSVIEDLLQQVREAQRCPDVEQRWRGEHYVLSMLDSEVHVAHISDVVSEDDFAEQVDSDGFGQVRQESVGGLEDFEALLQAWYVFVGS